MNKSFDWVCLTNASDAQQHIEVHHPNKYYFLFEYFRYESVKDRRKWSYAIRLPSHANWKCITLRYGLIFQWKPHKKSKINQYTGAWASKQLQVDAYAQQLISLHCSLFEIYLLRAYKCMHTWVNISTGEWNILRSIATFPEQISNSRTPEAKACCFPL